MTLFPLPDRYPAARCGVVEEVIPESLRNGFEGMATGGFPAGFPNMMVLDVGLG
ncbi:MAG: hypothetical protein HGA55_03695 [Methanoregulaceae archaeon]|nr:hypothetical protein [Methanoregulaceae archaeon]